MHSIAVTSRPGLSETVPKLFVFELPAMGSLGDIALNPSLRKSKREYSYFFTASYQF